MFSQNPPYLYNRGFFLLETLKRSTYITIGIQDDPSDQAPFNGSFQDILMIGTKLKHYQITSLLGEGGMGKVYQAYDETLERDVAIKVMASELVQDPDNVRRFYREARAAAGLTHPNIITIHEVGEEGGIYYFVMELLDGVPVERLSRGGPLPVEQAITIATDVCKALCAAHAKGILHRDIKADNVFLLKDGITKVLDFGIAFVSKAATLTRVGEVLGTVEYMAPEQILGEKVDERSDLYSLGVLMYKMLTGQMPFSGPSSVAIVYKQLEEQPIPPGNLNTAVPLVLENIVMKTLSKEAGDRYQTSNDLLKALEGLRHRVQEAAGVTPVEEPEEIVQRREFSSKFVGRGAEYQRLKGLFDTTAQGRGSTVFIGGEAGIGKTRLASEVMTYAKRKGAFTLTGVCLYQEGPEPYLPFVEAIAQYFDVSRNLPEEQRAKVKAFISREVPELEELTTRFRTQIGFQRETGGGISRERLFEAISQLLIFIADQAPLVLFLDDVHWASDASLQLLHYVSRNTAGHALMLVNTFRSEEIAPLDDGSPHPLVDVMSRMSREGLYERIDLVGLTQDDLAEMIRSIFKKSAFSADFRALLYRDTGGNPFFALEVIKLLRDHGMIYERNGIWREKEELTRFDIPERVHDLVVRRLQRLDEEQRDLLQAAAVGGEHFTSKGVSVLLGIDRLRVIKALGRLERIHQMIRSEGETYAFSHPKIGEVLYEEMPLELRQAYHVALAEFLEREASEDPYKISTDLGLHFWNGGAIDRAIPYLIRSADRASRLFAYKEACGYYEQILTGLEQLRRFPRHEEIRGEILQRAALAYKSLGQLDKALEQFSRLEHDADETGDILLKAKALQGIGGVRTTMRNYTEALRTLQESSKSFTEVGDLRGQCEVLNQIGNIYLERSEWETTIEYKRRALEIARQADHKRVIGSVYVNLGIIFGIRGNFELAMEQYRRAIEVYREMGDWTRVANVFNNMGKLCADSRMWERAKDYNNRAVEILQRTKDIPTMALAYLNAAEIDLALTDLTEAKRSCVRAIEMFKKLHDELGIADGLKTLGMIGAREGDWDGARSCFEQSLALNREYQNILGVAETLREYGVMLEMKGEYAQAVVRWKEARGIFEKIGAQESLKEVQEMIARRENS